MAVYIVTGKLGAGKTLLAVQKIQDYLRTGRQVATNIDLNVDKLCRPSNRHSRIVRLPDLPTADDLIGLDYGCPGYDEDKFGGIFLDEAGVWLNSRDWNQGGRSELLKFFLFLRKRRWDLYLLVQHVGVVDKQIRESIAEHVVYLNRLDRIKVPFLGPIGRILSLGLWSGRLPKLHYAVVKYGPNYNSPKVDDIYFRGEYIYPLYNTSQEYDKSYSSGSYCLLPPGYTRRRIPRARRGLGFMMRTTKVFLRRFRVVNAFFLGALVSCVLSFVVAMAYVVAMPVVSPATAVSASATVKPLSEEFSGFKVVSYIKHPSGFSYVFSDDSGRRVTVADLQVRDISVKDRGLNEALLVRGSDYFSLFR